MTRAVCAAVRDIPGSTAFHILGSYPTEREARCAHGKGAVILPIWYREGTRSPWRGERVDTFADVGTLYILAPKVGT